MPQKRGSDLQHRINLLVSPATLKTIAGLTKKTGATSAAEVIRNALKLYDGLVSETERGNTFLMRAPSGEITEFRMWL